MSTNIGKEEEGTIEANRNFAPLIVQSCLHISGDNGDNRLNVFIAGFEHNVIEGICAKLTHHIADECMNE
ncbi:MAG: hypothetical protein PHZ00_01535 [Candidatus Peribacteraceae bacterium]|nr:hypothetical protein [Candidatus Peribacteraceae bacterium]